MKNGHFEDVHHYYGEMVTAVMMIVAGTQLIVKELYSVAW